MCECRDLMLFFCVVETSRQIRHQGARFCSLRVRNELLNVFPIDATPDLIEDRGGTFRNRRLIVGLVTLHATQLSQQIQTGIDGFRFVGGIKSLKRRKLRMRGVCDGESRECAKNEREWKEFSHDECDDLSEVGRSRMIQE